MSTARFIIGDSLTVLRTLPDASVDLVLTSPPFLALRSYLPADHPDKAIEMGSEPTPGAFIDALLEVVEECRRVLAPHGSLCVELGDTYSGSGGAGGDYGPGGLRAGQERFDGSASRAYGLGAAPRPARAGRTTVSRRRDRAEVPRNLSGGHGWPEEKSLCLIPELFRFALVYGFNPLTGRQTPRWRVRNVVRWVRPNPPVGALGDKFRPATSEMVVACVGRKRYFDLDAVRGPSSPNTHARTARGVDARPNTGKSADDDRRGGNYSTLQVLHDTAGAPPLDWWAIPTEPFPGSHYATWPSDLLVRPIKAMCPERVCRTCGVPNERITEKAAEYAAVGRGWADETDGRGKAAQRERNRHSAQPPGAHIVSAEYVTTGWTDCGHADYRPGVVLDPFAGSGTTLAVATGHGRDAIGVDLDARNADLARARVGMFLTVETPAAEVPA